MICIDKNHRISDKASLRFSQVFYETLFVKKYSVCKAFQIAKEDIRTMINFGEANKFLMLVNEEHDAKGKVEKKHKCFPITKFNQGTLVKYEQIPLFNSTPANIDYFRGRQQEM